MNILFAIIISFSQTSALGIIKEYDLLTDGIKSGMIQTVIDNDKVKFSNIVDDLDFDVNKADLLFDFIKGIAAPQLGPGLAFGQFERRSEFTTNDESEYIELEHLLYSRNIALSAGGGMQFNYPGIYRVTIDYRGSTSTGTTDMWTMLRVKGLTSDLPTGHSVEHMTGRYALDGVNSVTFFINIEEINDVYMIEFVRNEAHSYPMSIAYPSGWADDIDDNIIYANVVLTVENVGFL